MGARAIEERKTARSARRREIWLSKGLGEMPRRFIAIVIVLASAGATSTPSRAQDQSRAIFERWIGKTLLAETPRGLAEIRFDSDGSARSTGAIEDKGSWRWDDTGYCATWQKLRGGREACFTISTIAGEHYVTHKGGNEVAAKVRVKP
jgi:hypothetical protein